MTCLLAMQQLQVGPVPTHVGSELVVTASIDSAPRAGVLVAVQTPDGDERRAGVTDAAGTLRFVPAEPGLHAFVASLDGVRCVAPISVGPPRRRWLLALASVPLGVALLVVLIRRAAQRR